MALVLFVFLAVMLVSVVMFQIEFWGAGIFMLFLIPVGLMIGILIFSLRTAATYNDAFQKIQQVCEDASKKQALVSYHLRNDVIVGGYSMNSSFRNRHTYRNVYIEVSISDTSIPGTSNNTYTTTTAACTTTASPYVSNVSNYGGSSQQQTPAQRLHALETIKHLLTRQEYDDKRAAILAAV
jgi:Ca2+/Na+ antiporter